MSATNNQDAQKSAWIRWRTQVAEALSLEEWEMLKLVARGLSNPEIATVMSKSEHAIADRLGYVMGKLRPFAVQAGVLSRGRAGLAVICLRAGQAVRVPCPRPWAVAMAQVLTENEYAIIKMAAEAKTDREFAQWLATAGVNEQLPVLYQKVKPFLVDTDVEQLDRRGLVELFVRAGAVASPAMYARWRASVRRLVSDREHDVVLWLARGLANREIGKKLDISQLTVKTHMRRVTLRLEPFGALVGVERPRNRAGLAVMTVLAGLDKALD